MIPAARTALVQKVGSLALLALVVLGAFLVVGAPLGRAATDAHDEVVAARERLAALKAKRVDLAALEAALKRETSRSAERPLSFEAPTSALGSERMEAQLRSIAVAQGTELSSARSLRLEDEAGLKALRMDVSMRAPRDRLTDLLAAIESAAPALFVERLRVTADVKRGAGEDERLELALTIRAFAAIGAQAATPQTAARK